MLSETEDEVAFSNSKDPQLAYEYARDFIEGRWPEGEEAIVKDPEYAYKYAKDVIKGPWDPSSDCKIESVIKMLLGH